MSSKHWVFRTVFTRAVGPALLLALGCWNSTYAASEDHWVTTWGCGVQLTEPRNLPPVPLANSTLRQFAHVTCGGSQLRLRFSNAYGTNAVSIQSAHVALAAGFGSAGMGEVNTATDKALTFCGASGAVIRPGETLLTDPCYFVLPPLTSLAVSLYLGDVSASAISGHPGSRTTSFIQSGNAAAAASLPAAAKTAHWYFLTGVEVWAAGSGSAVVVLGDSITDGRGSTTDGNDRWPDDLASRLHGVSAAAGVAVVNMGIGGNALFGGLGPAAVSRFDRDVLGQSGARWVIVFEGVNDIGGAADANSPALATRMITAYAQFADKAHARGLRAYGATITPFGGNGYYSAAHEAARQAVNTWMRTNALYDGLIDFDQAVRDPVTLTNLLSAYDCGDHLHLSPAGYKTMADAVNLNLFAP